MSFLGFRERIALRRAVISGINNGQLPQSASLVLYSGDAFAELERQVFGQAQVDAATAAATGGTSAPAHPILAWIVSHAPQILQFVLMILPLFGVNVPPISIPGLPTPGGTPSPTPSMTGGSGADPTAPAAAIHHASAHNPTQPDWFNACPATAAAGGGMPADFALPGGLSPFVPLIEQIAAQVVAAVLPQLEAKLEAWVKSHIGGTANAAA